MYLEDADSVEYVRRDVACTYHRVDGFLTLAYEMKTHELIGFRLKGFKNFFLKELQPKYGYLENDFVPLVSAIEQRVQRVGDQLTGDAVRSAAYLNAKRMADDDSIEIPPLAA